MLTEVKEVTEEKDYKLGCSILEAEVSQLTEENNELNDELSHLREDIEEKCDIIEKLESDLETYKECLPTLKSLADMSRLERLLKGFNKITESDLTKWGL